MRKHRLIAFFVIAFGLSWGVAAILLLTSSLGTATTPIDRHSLLSFLFFWAPAVAACLVVGITQGQSGLTAFFRHVLTGRFKWRWWVAVIIGVPLLKLLAYALSADGLPFGLQQLLTDSSIATALILALLESPVSEIGWRGFALPLLQRRMNGLIAGVILGAIWAAWYMPWLLPGTVMNWSLGGDSIPSIVRFFGGTIALSITMTVIFNGSSGSVPLMFLFRWLNSPPLHWSLGSHLSYLDTVITITTAVVLIFILRKRYLSRANRYTKVTPGVASGMV